MMFKNTLSDVFPFLHRIYDLTELILVGSNISDWLDILQKSDIEKVHYINQASLDYKFETLPPNWEVTTKILAQENGEIAYYTLTNSMLNGTIDSKVLAKLWTNLETLSTGQKEAVSLKSFIEDKCIPNSSKILVVDSFDGLHILNDLSNLDINVVAIRVISSDENEFNFVSQRRVNQKFIEWGYKNIATYDDNHPKIKTTVYVQDTKQQIKKLQDKEKIEKENLQTELANAKALKKQELFKLKAELEKKINELQENINTESAEKENLQKKLVKSAANSTNANIDEFIDDMRPFFYNKAITYVDVGAYVGEVFMKLRDLKKFSIREAHLFEPNPESYEQMLENLKSYELTSLNTYNFGIGKKREIANFISSKSMTKKHEIDFTSNKENIFQSEIVPLVDMSSVFTEGHIHLLKIDVEGSEMGVLKGASSLLESQAIDVIYMEVGFNKKGTQQTYFCKLDKYMQNFGYRVFKFYEQKYEWIEDLPYLRRGNVAYISTKFAKANPSKLVFQNNQLKQELEDLKKGKEK